PAGGDPAPVAAGGVGPRCTPKFGRARRPRGRNAVAWVRPGRRVPAPVRPPPLCASPAVPYPKTLRVRQTFERPVVRDIPGTVPSALERLDLGRPTRPGQTVALTAGSRGIANIPAVLRATADFLKGLGARPFLIPAMGSHGGGTAEGQRQIIESYGITEY